MSQRGQILIVIAVLILAVMLFLALAVDVGRLYIERSRMSRAAQSAADAGISIVAEKMVTQVVARQTSMAATPSPTQPAIMTATPPLWDVQSWLSDENRVQLVSAEVQTIVESVARDYVQMNGFDEDDLDVIAVEVIYPQPDYDPWNPGMKMVQVLVRIRRQLVFLLAGLIGSETIELAVESVSQVQIR